MTLVHKWTERLTVKVTTLHTDTDLMWPCSFTTDYRVFLTLSEESWALSPDKIHLWVQDTEHAILWYQHRLSCCNILCAVVCGSWKCLKFYVPSLGLHWIIWTIFSSLAISHDTVCWRRSTTKWTAVSQSFEDVAKCSLIWNSLFGNHHWCLTKAYIFPSQNL